MKSKKKIIVFAVIVLMLSVIFCFLHDDIKKDNNNINSKTKETDEEETDEEETEGENDNNEYGNMEIGIYSIDYDNQECEPSVIVVPKGKKVDESYIVEEVIANFNDEVNIKDVKNKDNDITVVFQNNSAPACNVSATMEELMLNCIAYSLIDNIEGCRNIYFKIENDGYTGVSIALSPDEPYISADVSEDEYE